MKVLLVRHADADAEIPEGLGDDERALTSKARVNIASHFSALADRIGSPDIILTSPLVRTVQTASILSATLGYEGPLRAHRSLLPDMPVGAIDGVLQELDVPSVLLVGHNPSMSAMAAYLLGLPTFPKQVNPGTVIGVQRSGDAGQLLFYAAPGQAAVEAL